jgi:hypothetical protein
VKFIAFFMAFLLPALSFLPCADIATHVDDCNKKILVSAPAHQHSDPGDNDGCSPFCHCACCAAIAFQQIGNSFSIINLSAKNKSSIYLHADILHIASEVWQPPRFC